MNKQQKVEIANLVGDITALAQMINIETEMAVFVHIHGHVEKLEIQIVMSKQDYHNQITRDEIMLNPENGYRPTPERIIQRLNKAKSELRKILRERDVDYSRLNYSERIERDYHLM